MAFKDLYEHVRKLEEQGTLPAGAKSSANIRQDAINKGIKGARSIGGVTTAVAEALSRKAKTQQLENLQNKKARAEKALADFDENADFDATSASDRKRYDNRRKQLEKEAKQAAGEMAAWEEGQTWRRDTDEIEAMNPEDRKALEQYAVNQIRDQNLPVELAGSPFMKTAAQESAGLIGKIGKQRADELAETFMRQENAKLAQQVEGEARQLADEHGVLASAATIPVTAVSGLIGSVGQLQGAARRTGRYQTLDPNATGTIGDTFTGAVRGQVQKNIEGENPNLLRKAASIGYQGIMSAADSIARAYLGGGAWGGAALAATGSFSQTMADASRQGATPAQAALLATSTAAIEALSEKIPLDNLIKHASGGKQPVKTILKNALIQAGIEATTEEISLVGSLLAEAAILREKSNYEQTVMVNIMQGKSATEARNAAAMDVWKEAVNTALVSMVSGGVSSAGAGIAGNVQNSSEAKTTAQTAPKGAEDIKRQVLEKVKAMEQQAQESVEKPAEAPEVQAQAPTESKPQDSAEAPSALQPEKQQRPKTGLDVILETIQGNGANVSNKMAESVLNDAEARAQLVQQTGTDIAGSKAEQRKAVKDAMGRLITERAETRKEQMERAPAADTHTDVQMSARNVQEQSADGGQKIEGIKGTGAAEANFSGKAAYQDLLTDENTQRDRPGDVRPIEVPKTDGYGRKVSEFVGNAYGAEVTPNRMANEIETLVQEGALGYDQRSNKQSLEVARDYIYGIEGSKGKGEAATRHEISRNIANGRIQDGDIEKAMILYAKAANRKSDSSLDHASELFVDLATMARMSGRNLQLFKLLRKMTPEGQLMAVQKNIDRCIEDINRSRTKKNKVGNNQSAETEKVVTGAISSAKEDTTEIIKEAGRKVRYGNGKVTVEGNQAGEPFVFEYAQKVGEALAKGLENSQKPKQRKEKTFMQTITDELRKFAAEKMPQQKRNRKTLTATELLRDYVQNQEFYAEAWGAAQEALRKNHGDDPAFQEFMNSGIGVDANVYPRNKIMAKALAAAALETGETTEMLRKQQALGITGMSDTIANKLIQETGATGEMAQTIRDAAKEFVNGRIREADDKKNARTYEPGRFVDEAMRDIKKTMSEVAKQNTRGREAAKQSIIRTLTQKYGFGEADASHIAEVVGSSFDQKTQEQARKLLEQKLGEKEKRKPRSAGEMIEEYANLGAYAPDSNYSDKATESFIRVAMQDIGKSISDLAKSGKADRAAVKAQLSQMITQRHGIDKADADHIAEVVGEQLSGMVEEQAKKILEQRFADRKKSEKKNAAQLMTEYSNLGAFDIGSKYNVQASSKILGGNYGIGIDEELAEAYKNAKTDEARQTLLDAIYVDAAGRIPSTMEDKWNAWRYMAMLGNAKTQVRNLAGNAAIMPYKAAKDKMAAIFERAIPKDQRTKALTTDRELLSWAKADAKSDDVQNALKYSAKLGDDLNSTKIRENMKVFDTKALERVRKFVEKVPQAGDMLFKNSYYERSLAGFLKARGYKAADIQSGKVSDTVLSEARSYAIQEAMKATFNDSNAFSDFMATGLRYKGDNPIGKALNIAAEGVLPFRRTPANIVVRFTEYSPVGLAKGAWDMATKVRNGDISAAAAIDQISAGMTGTAVMALGYFLASGIAGVKITGSGTDEDEKRQGHQDYALEFSIDGQDYSYKIDWAAPANLPLFVGANIKRMMEEAGAETDVSKFTSILHGMGTMFEPMLALSCMSSFNDLVEGIRYAPEGEALYSAAADIATSYFTQGIPALARQAAQAMQENKQTTFANSADPTIRDLQKTAANIPFVGAKYQTDKVNAWGEKETTESAAERVVNTFVNPGTLKKVSNDPLEKEITRLNEAQGDSVSPPTAAKTISYTDKDGNVHKNVRLTEEQYQTFANTQGQTAKEILTAMINSEDYKAMTDSQKADAIREVYSYAREKAEQAAFPDSAGYSATWMADLKKGSEAEIILRRTAGADVKTAMSKLDSAWDNGFSSDVTGAKSRELEAAYNSYAKMSPAAKAQVREDASGTAAKYIEAREKGISHDAFIRAAENINKAKGTGTNGSVREIDRRAAIAKTTGLSANQVDTLMKCYMEDYDPNDPGSEKTELKYNYFRQEMGLSPHQYADTYRAHLDNSKKPDKIAAIMDLGYDKQTATKLYNIYASNSQGKKLYMTFYEENGA